MGGSSQSTQSTTTTSYVDSFNTTYDQVLNVSNVGNVGINLGTPPPANPWGQIAPALLVAAVAISGWVLLKH